MRKFQVIFNKYKYHIMSAVLFLLVVLLIFVIVFFYSDTDESVVSDNDNSFSENITDSANNDLSGDSRFLVVCNGDLPGDIIFMTLVDFKIYSEKIIVTPLSADTSSASGTYSDCYSYGGITMLKNSIEATRNCEIDRYVIIDEDGFCEMIDIMGKVEVFVEEEYTYASSDKYYTIETGVNELEAPMLFSYLKLKSAGDDNAFADLLCLIVNTYISSFNIEDTQEYFEDLSNCINSDLSIQDYYSAKSDIEYLISNNPVCIPFYQGEQ